MERRGRRTKEVISWSFIFSFVLRTSSVRVDGSERWSVMAHVPSFRVVLSPLFSEEPV